MYTPLTLYYLNQIGIRPWIKRNNTERELTTQDAKLFVLFPEHLSSKAKNLLKQMMNYVNLEQSALVLIPLQNTQLNEYAFKMKQQNPLAILTWGFNSLEQSEDFNCPILMCDAPDSLLQNPLKKKEIFKVLSDLNQLILEGLSSFNRQLTTINQKTA